MLTLPNLLTLARIGVVPALVGVFYLEGDLGHWLAFGLFAAAAATDFLDGRIARARGQISDFGRVFDPIADKLLVATALVMLLAFDRAPVLAVALILLREILVAGLREGLAGRLELAVSRLAKWKTAAQMAAAALLLIGAAGPAAFPFVGVGEGLLWLAAGLTWITGLDYLRSAWRHLGTGASGGPDGPAGEGAGAP